MGLGLDVEPRNVRTAQAGAIPHAGLDGGAELDPAGAAGNRAAGDRAVTPRRVDSNSEGFEPTGSDNPPKGARINCRAGEWCSSIPGGRDLW
jgi:hypothetical protein